MAGWEYLDINNWKYSMIDVMIVYISSDSLFPYMMYILVNSLVDDGWT